LRFRFTVVVIKSRRLPGDQCSLWGAQMRRTSRAFAQWNLILEHLQHSKFDIVYTSHRPFETFHWLCVCMVVKLHAHWHKYLLNVKFSCREHCWWLTSQTCVNTLIDKTNFKFEATTLYQYEILLFIWKSHTKYVGEPQFAHHWFEPTWLTAMRSHCLAALPAKMSAFNRHMQQNAYHPILKCIFEDLLPCYCYARKANSRTICSRVSQPASAGKEADLVNCKLITACYQNSEPDSCAVWVSYRQTNCHCKN